MLLAVAGFLIALMVGITGVGGGVLTVPVLILLFGVEPAQAVGSALVFAAVIKFFLVPLVAARKQVDWRVLGWMLLGGVPGAVIGGFALKSLNDAGAKPLLNFVLGLIIASAAVIHLRFALRAKSGQVAAARDRSRWLGLLMLPVGLEVGFSSAGAGALGSIALLSFTTLAPAAVVGTDLAFGLGVSTIAGGLHLRFGDGAWGIIGPLLSGGIPGALVGALVSTRVSARALKFALSTSLLFIGLHLCWTAVVR